MTYQGFTEVEKVSHTSESQGLYNDSSTPQRSQNVTSQLKILIFHTPRYPCVFYGFTVTVAYSTIMRMMVTMSEFDIYTWCELK